MLFGKFAGVVPLLSVALLSVTLLLFALLPGADAQKRLPPLSNGMNYSDVIAMWGAPESKQERESKRDDIWVYPKGKVFFHEGRVVGWVDKTAIALTLQGQEDSAPKSGLAKPGQGKTEEVEQILNEIMKELPSGEAGGSGSAANGSVSPPGEVPPQVLGVPPAPMEVE